MTEDTLNHDMLVEEETLFPPEPMPDIEVELIDHTGIGHPDKFYAARLLVICKSTRLEQNAATRARIMAMPEAELMNELDAISKSIKSSWEFVNATWQVRFGTRAYTHQQVRSRLGRYAQQAQRVVDMSNFTYRIPDTVKGADKEGLWRATMGMIASTYKLLRDAGVPAQDARGVLPTNIHTNILCQFDLRCFAGIVGKRDNLRAQDEYAEIVRLMADRLIEAWPWAYMFLYPDHKHTPNLDAIIKERLGKRSPVDEPLINGALKEVDMLKGTWDD